ncbi:hypothetical protein ACFT8W_13330 [Streptomyces hygroscopicus]
MGKQPLRMSLPTGFSKVSPKNPAPPRMCMCGSPPRDLEAA